MLDIQKTIFLTFDIDWACDEILGDTVGLVESAKVRATFFVTHQTPLLERLRSNRSIELGIHPNFNNLLASGNTSEGGVAEILTAVKSIVPEATSVRSHSLVQSTRLLDIFSLHGLTHDVNLLIPASSGIKLYPIPHWNGMLRVPYFWEDDVHCMFHKDRGITSWDVGGLLDHPGLKVFNFHPIHLFLNTENLERYEASKKYHRQANHLCDFRCTETTVGTRVFLQNLISEAKRRGMKFGLISEVEI